MKSRRELIASLLMAFLATAIPSQAQQANGASVRLQGKIISAEGAKFTLALEGGGTKAFVLAGNAIVTRRQPARLEDIKAGEFVASAAKKGTDGKLHSTELRIFPEAMRGLGEGQHPMADPALTMTNADVSEVMASPQGQVLKVKFKGGVSELVVDKSVPISEIVVSDASTLTVGTPVFVLATTASDGTLTATRVFGN